MRYKIVSSKLISEFPALRVPRDSKELRILETSPAKIPLS